MSHHSKTHRRGDRPNVVPTVPLPSGPTQSLPAGAARRMGWGRAAAAIWYLGGFVLLLVSAVLQVGPSAWVAAWQVRHWGSDNSIASFLPGFIVLAAPMLMLNLLPRQAEGSFLCGMQDALAPNRSRSVQPPSPERMAHFLLCWARGALVAAGVFLLAGGLGYELITRIGSRGAGTPLPELAFAAVAAQGAALPTYARLIGATPQPEFTWLHEHSERRTYHRDAFTPLTGRGWRPGDAVVVLEEDRTVPGDGGTDAVLPPGPPEGALERRALPGWMLDELRRRGVAVTDDPVVLIRQELGGVVPDADTIMAVLCLVFGGTFAVFALGASFAYRYRRRRILRTLADTATGLG